MTSKLRLDEPAEAVARLTIDNPERRGALDHELLDALAGFARALEARCLVIRTLVAHLARRLPTILPTRTSPMPSLAVVGSC